MGGADHQDPHIRIGHRGSDKARDGFPHRLVHCVALFRAIDQQSRDAAGSFKAKMIGQSGPLFTLSISEAAQRAKKKGPALGGNRRALGPFRKNGPSRKKAY
jgi:hypothetical protein